MGRSASSCFKIITCGGDSVADKDDAEASEIKGDKRRWSFRKRSARHRVLSNIVISETVPSPPPAVKKEASESTAPVNFEPITDVQVPEKVQILQCDEKSQVFASVDSKQFYPTPLVNLKNESAMDIEIEESTIVLIQSAVRGFLAQRKLQKLKKNVIKLQAAVRGHLVRRHAVGTLRCIQAIVKMQGLVRARKARTYSPADNQVANERSNEDAPKSNDSDKANAKNKSTVSYVSIEKLLSNRFARQLLESTPREKPINIKCDRSKSNSAWKWLERWMSASTAEPSPNINLTTELPESEKEDSSISQAETKNSAETSLKAADSSSGIHETEETSVDDENVIIYEEEKVKFNEYQSDSQVMQEIVAPPIGKEILEPEHPQSDEVMASDDITLVKSSASERNDPHDKPEMESEQPKGSMKRFSSEELGMEGKKSALGSKKATNPAFLAAQFKFEELSSAANSGALINRSDVSELEVAISREDSEYGVKESNLVESSSANDQARLQVGGSECGTELSISSTLDSPDMNDAAKEEFGRDAEIPEKDSYSSTVHNDQTIEPESTEIPDTTLSNTVSDHPEKNSDDVVCGSTNKVLVAEAVQPEATTPKLLTEVNLEMVHQAHNGTSGHSPRNHIIVPESLGTPASQVSVDTKGSKFDKIGPSSIHKRKSLSNKSPSSPYNDASASSVNKQSGKDQRSSKRRNSFGSAKPENADQESRESSSSSSTLPRFMQATESAKAKVHANNSPRSSPDVADRETFIKKRQLQPGGNGSHGSLQIQQSTSQSQVQQGRKANGGSTQERKWLR